LSNQKELLFLRKPDKKFSKKSKKIEKNEKNKKRSGKPP
jgi:hypothetical protein